MSGNSIGKFFRLMSFGESHGSAVGGVIDGCPAGIALSADFIQGELNRRRPGQSEVSTPRKEEDTVEILSGIFEGKSTGMPIGFLVRNQNQNSKDYNHLKIYTVLLMPIIPGKRNTVSGIIGEADVRRPGNTLPESLPGLLPNRCWPVTG